MIIHKIKAFITFIGMKLIDIEKIIYASNADEC